MYILGSVFPLGASRGGTEVSCLNDTFKEIFVHLQNIKANIFLTQLTGGCIQGNHTCVKPGKCYDVGILLCPG